MEEQLCGLTCDATPGSSVMSNCARVGPLARLPTSWAKAHTEVLVSICTSSPWYSHLPHNQEHVKCGTVRAVLVRGKAHQQPCSSPPLWPEAQLLEADRSSEHDTTCGQAHAAPVVSVLIREAGRERERPACCCIASSQAPSAASVRFGATLAAIARALHRVDSLSASSTYHTTAPSGSANVTVIVGRPWGGSSVTRRTGCVHGRTRSWALATALGM